MSNGFDRAQRAYENMMPPEFYYDEIEAACYCPECGKEETIMITYDTRIRYDEEREPEEKCPECGEYFVRA